MSNSKSQAGTGVQQSDEVDVTTSAPITPNPMLAVVLFVFKVLNKRNLVFFIVIICLLESLFRTPNYIAYIFVLLVAIFFEICDLVDLTKKKQHIKIENNINNNLINETGFPLTIKNEN